MISLDRPNYKLTGHIEEPKDLDYNLYGLHKMLTLNNGELTSIDYYRNFDGETYSDLVVREERVYTRNEISLALYRTQTSKWYLEDGTIGCTKVTTKYYTSIKSMDESDSRRRNLVNDAKLVTFEHVGIENALDLMESVNTEISLYIQGKTELLMNAILTSVKPYMTAELRADIIYSLTLQF